MKKYLLAVALCLGSCASAWSADLPSEAPPPAPAPVAPELTPYSFIDELRMGAYIHDAASKESVNVPDLNLEVLFAKPWGTNDQWWLPRPMVGATINFEGRTSTAFAGAAWQYYVTKRIFVEATFGGSVNNGDDNGNHDHNAVGSALLFHESGSIGYDLTDHWRILATIEHNSNAGLTKKNRGLTNYGGQIGYRF
jgi:lipid A 3-O-deacylase